METVKFFSGEQVPLEMHKVRMVQRLNLLPVEERKKAMEEAGYNTFLLKNRDVFLDMLTDSGVNAMSDRQYAAMMLADDSYAGSETFYKLEKALQDVFGTKYFLPAHQGRACEHILSKAFVTQGSVALMNFHFTTTKALITESGGSVEEIVSDAGLEVTSSLDFKGNIDMGKLQEAFDRLGKEKISFVRLEAGTNLIGGQPISMQNIREVSAFCREHELLFIIDASLLADNLYFVKVREPEFADVELNDITREMGKLADIIYFSARKLGCARGGGILTSSDELYSQMRTLVPLFEGFITYGGMSVREMEAMAIGMYETLDFHVIEQTPIFVKALSDEFLARGIPVVTPAGGLGCHLDATRFCEHLPQTQYQAGALASAAYIAAGVRGMERGTLSEQRNPDGSERFSNMELLRLAFPKRVFTLSQVKYIADRIDWLYQNRELIGGLEFIEEPPILRFFFGRLKELGGWTDKLVAKFRADFGDSL
ncbi:MAG: tryptophanase [Oscillospiraceae bacterium]|jgi:tryptophanase|nr:tryptophanase [Oscillospiraceae bacterium]